MALGAKPRKDLSGAASRRRLELRRATRSTPRHGSSVSAVVSDDNDVLARAAARAMLYSLSSFNEPAMSIKVALRHGMPSGLAMAFSENEIVTRAGHFVGVAGPMTAQRMSAATDLEFEAEPDGRWRLVAARPWLSTLLGCDADDEDAHAELIHQAVTRGGVPAEVDVVFLCPRADNGPSRRLRRRLERLCSTSGLANYKMVDPFDLSSEDLLLAWDEVTARIKTYDPLTGRLLHLSVPAAYPLENWPRWLVALLREQDKERFAISSVLSSADEAPAGVVVPDIDLDGVLIGRKSIRRGVSSAITTDCVDEVGDGGVVRIREVRSDRAFVFDHGREPELVPEEGDLIIESPPRVISDAYAAGRPLTHETRTLSLAPVFGGEEQLEDGTRPLLTVQARLGVDPADLIERAQQDSSGSVGIIANRHSFSVSWISAGASVGAVADMSLSMDAKLLVDRVRRARHLPPGLAEGPRPYLSLTTALLRTGQPNLFRATLVCLVSLFRSVVETDQDVIREALRGVGGKRGRDLWARASCHADLRQVLMAPPDFAWLARGTRAHDRPNVIDVVTELLWSAGPESQDIHEVAGAFIRALAMVESYERVR